jgi:hypothetical protein
MPLQDASGNDRLHRVARVASLHLQGWGVPAIAKEVG